MKLPTHPAFKRRINGLMLFHSRNAAKTLRDDARSIMIAITGKIGNFDIGIRNRVPDHRLEAKGDLPTRRHLDAAVNANRSFRSPAGFDLHANPPSIGALS